MITQNVPAPQVDIESRPYWDALREHRISVQRCTTCGRLRFPPMPGCPYCGARGFERVDVSGEGRVYSFVRVHRALTPAMEGEVPYVVAVVQLDGGGPRIIGRVDGDLAAVAIDDAVVPRFVDHDTWTELRFTRAVGAQKP
ncbi:MAG TPA: OB-fold domain-containing protein [Candidatus Angelobacter sp.]|nr:OB-fold domain-containing protein [Candidatus Angelobacter sp.]